MEDVEPVDGSPPASIPEDEIPESAKDPLRPEIEEDNSPPTPPLSDPDQDTEAVEETGEKDIADDESELSEIDEAQFEDFDPEAIDIEAPVEVDEAKLRDLKPAKRKRDDGEEAHKKKKKKRDRRARSDDGDNFDGGDTFDGRRARKHAGAVGPRDGRRSPVNDDDLNPEQRRQLALDKALNDAVKNHNRTKRQTGFEIEAANDGLVDELRHRMATAAHIDTEERREGRPATRKLQMLPEVLSILNSGNLRHHVVDPENNLLESVRFFLEPLEDGTLPAYKVQIELFKALANLPIGKDALIASGIGKVIVFYTKSIKAEPIIKRVADRLMAEWTRPILKRNMSYRKRTVPTADFNPADRRRNAEVVDPTVAAMAAARERQLATPTMNRRVRKDETLRTYTIAPRNNVTAQPQYARPTGVTGEDAVRKIKARQMARSGVSAPKRR